MTEAQSDDLQYTLGERAVEVLHRYSTDHNVKLRDVAATVAETRGLPTEELNQT